MNKITFSDKVDTKVVSAPEINKVTASTLNEVKTIVNETVDQVEINITGIATNVTNISTNVTDIGQTVRITGDQSIAGIKTFTDNVIAITQANSINDTTVATTAYVKNLISELPSGLNFEGTWNADTDSPDLSAATPNSGEFWIVSVNGSTNLSGITDWKVGDWAIYVTDGTGADGWQKVDNSSVLDGQGTGQRVALWSGSGDSNTLTNAPITVSGNDVAVTGDVTAINGVLTGKLDLNDSGNSVFIGKNAGLNDDLSDNRNTGIGYNSLSENTNGERNTGIGFYVLSKITTGSENIGIGSFAGQYITGGVTPNTTGSNSVFIGYATSPSADGETNQIVIGDTVIGNGSNTATLGNDSITDTYLKGIVHGSSSAEFDSSVSATDGIFSANVKVVSISGQDDSLPVLGSDSGKFKLFNNGGSYGLIGGVLGDGNSFLQSQRVDGTAVAYNLLLNPIGGNVLIGTTADNGSKLQVNGSAKISSTVQAAGYKSSDGSAGISTTYTIKANDELIIKNGLITGINEF